MLVEVVVDFFPGIQFVRWRYRRGRVFLFLDLINSLIIPQGYFALRYTIWERIALRSAWLFRGLFCMAESMSYH